MARMLTAERSRAVGMLQAVMPIRQVSSSILDTMMLRISIAVQVLLLLQLQYANCARVYCYECSNIRNVSECHTRVHCQEEHDCSITSTGSGDTRRFNLGCRHKDQCPTVGPIIVGRDVTSPSCDECCAVNGCNKHMCAQNPVNCAVCSGPPQLCEKIYASHTCYPPNNYCINHIVNDITGDRQVNRTCGNFDTCYREWFTGSSDSDRCRKFDENFTLTLAFECTFCCVNDDCNVPLRPAKDSLYNEY